MISELVDLELKDERLVFDHKVMRQPAHVSTILAICASPSIEKAGPKAPTRYTQRAQGVARPDDWPCRT